MNWKPPAHLESQIAKERDRLRREQADRVAKGEAGRINKASSLVKWARERQGMSQPVLSHKSGVSQPQISRIEGGAQPSWETFSALASALELTADDLYRHGVLRR